MSDIQTLDILIEIPANSSTKYEVDEETGEVRVIKLTTAHNTGAILNPLTHQGQITPAYAVVVDELTGEVVRDELTGETYHWGRANYVRLEPGQRPAHVFSVLRPSTPQIGGSPTK